MDDKHYNGWTNYETWCVAVWLNNDEYSYNIIKRLLRHRSNKLADEIREYVENADLGASMCADLLDAALCEVNWHEIAKHYDDEQNTES